MIDSPDTVLDLTEYRHIAGYVLALLLLRRYRGHGALRMRLRSLRDASWLASRLDKQGYTAVSVETQGEQAVLQIHAAV